MHCLLNLLLRLLTVFGHRLSSPPSVPTSSLLPVGTTTMWKIQRQQACGMCFRCSPQLCFFQLHYFLSNVRFRCTPRQRKDDSLQKINFRRKSNADGLNLKVWHALCAPSGDYFSSQSKLVQAEVITDEFSIPLSNKCGFAW